jgi:Domain of unknown function (DUF4062)
MSVAREFRVFISAVSGELKSYRIDLARVLRRKELEVRDQEHFRQGPATLLEQLAAYIQKCDAVIMLIGERAGEFPSNNHTSALGVIPIFEQYSRETGQTRVSYSQWEFLLAKHYGKQTYVFFTGSDFTPDSPNDEANDARSCQAIYRRWIDHKGEHRNELGIRAKLIEDVLVLPFPDLSQQLSQRGEQATTGASNDLGIATVFRTRVRAFFDAYLTSEMGEVPFGGRDRELQRLNSWLLDETAAPRMLITAPAGRGKSALIIQWMKLICHGARVSDEWQLAFMPISIRIGTNRPGLFLEGLARRLAEITRYPLPSEVHRNVDAFRYVVRDQLDRIAASRKRVLVVFDGLDEALQGTFDSSILPPKLPQTLRILLSGRWQVGDIDSTGWLRRLGWDRNVRVETFDLHSLSTEAIVDVLMKLDEPFCALAQDRPFIARLLELTGGEPILVRYYAEDLRHLARSGVRVGRSDLDTSKPGFEGYFEHWFEDLEKQWKAEEANVNRNEIDIVLSILAFAYGPLEAGELLELIRVIYHKEQIFSEHRLLQPLRRFILGDGKPGHGYVLAHPKIAQHLQLVRFAVGSKELQRGLAKWGQDHLRGLNAGSVLPQNASPYVLQFLGKHFEDIMASPAEWMEFVENGWRGAWEYFEGGSRGFSDNVLAAWNALRQHDPLCSISGQWRCILAVSSIRSIGYNMPGPLIVAAARAGVLSIAQAAHLTEMSNTDDDCVDTLAHLALLSVSHLNQCCDLISAAVQKATLIRDGDRCGKALESIIRILSPILGSAHGTQAARQLPSVDATSELQRNWYEIILPGIRRLPNPLRANILLPIVSVSKPPYRAEITNEVLAGVKGIDRSWTRAEILRSLVSHLSPKQIDEVLSAINHMNNESARADALRSLAPFLSVQQSGEAVSAAERIKDNQARAQALNSLASYLPANQRECVLANALAAAKSIADKQIQAKTLGLLAQQLAPEQRARVLNEAFEVAETIGDERARGDVLASLFSLFSLKQRTQAVAAAMRICDGSVRATVLASFAPHLLPEQRACAFAAVEAIHDEHALAETVGPFAPYLTPEQLGTLLTMTRAIGDAQAHAKVLGSVFPHLSPAQRTEAFAAAEQTHDERARATALTSFAPHLSSEQCVRALVAIMAIQDKLVRAKALESLAPHLPPEQLGGVLATLKNIVNPAQTLASLALQLPTPWRSEFLREALVAARDIGDDRIHAHILRSVAPYLSLEHLGQILAAAKDTGRLKRLEPVALYLSTEQLRDVLPLTKRIGDEQNLVAARWQLAKNQSPERRDQGLHEALAAAPRIRDERDYAQILRLLAPYMSGEQLRKVIAGVTGFRSGWTSAEVLRSIVPHLAAEELAGALAAAKTIVNDWRRAEALGSLAPYLEASNRAEAVHEAIAIAERIGSDWARTQILGLIAPHLLPEQCDNALRVAEHIGTFMRVPALAWLVPHLLEPQRSVTVCDALATAKGIDIEWVRALAFISLFPHLSAKQRCEVLADVMNFDDEWIEALALRLLGPHLSVMQRVDALTAIDGFRSEWTRMEVLQSFGRNLSTEQLDAALATAKSMRREWIRAETLGSLAPHLPLEKRAKTLMEAVKATNTIEDEQLREMVFEFLLPRLSAEQLIEVLAAAEAIGDTETRLKLLTRLASYAIATQHAALLDLLLTTAVKCPRDQVLRAIAACAHILGAVGGAHALEDICHAIDDVARWYP